MLIRLGYQFVPREMLCPFPQHQNAKYAGRFAEHFMTCKVKGQDKKTHENVKHALKTIATQAGDQVEVEPRNLVPDPPLTLTNAPLTSPSASSSLVNIWP
jgi:hypothetical protein